MGVVIKYIPELIIPATITTTTTADDYNFSPGINWYQISDNFRNDRQSFYPPTATNSFIHDRSCRSTTTTSHATAPTHSKEPTNKFRHINLLMAAAEALARDRKCPDLARVILVWLTQLFPADHAAASGIECLAAHFTEALLSLLDNPHQLHHPAGEILTAFKSLHDMFCGFTRLFLNRWCGGRRIDFLQTVGFGRVGAQLLLALFNDGYHVEKDATNKLALSWKKRRLMFDSV